jgi:hypothetical protein
MSAMVTSSVSPERWETMTPQPALKESFAAWMASEMVPIWLTLRSSAFAALVSIAFLIKSGFVTVRSSLNG